MPALETLNFQDHTIYVRRSPRQRRQYLKLNLKGEIWVSTAMGTSKAHIVEFVAKNATWLEKQQSKLNALKTKFPEKRFVEDEEFHFLGVAHKLKFKFHSLKKFEFKRIPNEFHLYIPDSLSHADSRIQTEVEKLMRLFYEQAGKMILPMRLKKYAILTGLTPKHLKVRASKGRWGSCSSEGNIILNWRLMYAPLEVVDYVIVHELCHLKHMNHSKKFWSLVADHMPNYRQSEKWLKENQSGVLF